MGERLIKPYEISVWEDKLIQDGAEYNFKEKKLAVIGSDTMTGLNRVYDPIFYKKSNGEKTLTFSLKYKYFDPYSGNQDIVNPFAALLVNERKIKLHYDNQWYEFVIRDHTESSDELTWTYTCTDAFVLELSKNGYSITFDSELNNNQGTANELAEKTLENTDWQVGGTDIFKQYIDEPIYEAVLNSTQNVDIRNVSSTIDSVPAVNSNIYVFYSYVKNKDGKFVQFIIRDNNRKYVIDDKNVITDTNFRIYTELTYKNDGFYLGNDKIITINNIENRYHANRLGYNQLTTYDSVMKRTVDRFKINNNNNTEIYKYTDYKYTTSNLVINYITNGENFNALEDGTLQGWNPYTDQSTGEVHKLELITKPELSTSSPLAELSELSSIEGFLKVEFNGAKTEANGKIYNTIYNSGIENHISMIDSIAKGDKFVFRWRAATGTINSLTATDNLGLIVATYSQDTSVEGRYYKHINANDVILRFDKIALEQNPIPSYNYITGGTFQLNQDRRTYSYVIDGVVQIPSTKYIYKSGNDERVWTGTNYKEVKKGSNYRPYYYFIAEAQKAISNTELKNSNKKIGIFIYNTIGSGTYFIQDIQLTRYYKDKTGQPVLVGNAPVATSIPIEYYYIKPDKDAIAEDVKTYANLSSLAHALSIPTNSIKPLYNENSEKTLSISVSKSNCFNILQIIAETFECWVDLVVEHDEQGYIIYDENNIPQKYVYLREYIGKDNWAGFKYGINLQSIERTINSEEIVTKLLVDQSQSDLVEEGYVSIINAPSNQSEDSFILNFDYYYNQGLLNREEAEIDKNAFIESLAQINQNIKEKEKECRDLESALITLESNKNVYSDLLTTAQDTQTRNLDEFKRLNKNMTYEDYIQKHLSLPLNQRLTEDETMYSLIGELYTASATINNYSGLLAVINKQYQETDQKLNGLEGIGGVKKEIEALIEEKTNIINSFENKYRKYILEGTWNSTDYIDSELYYLDAIQVSNTSAQPIVSYAINVVEVSQLEGLEYYEFDVGDKSYVEDTEFFGWSNKEGVLTPAREEVIVSEAEWHLDSPEENVITVQNYKTRFEDLFQRVSAAVQTVQYNEATYAKISSLLDANGTINQNVLLASLNNISGKNYALTSDGSILIDGDKILVRNLTNPANCIIINSEGIRISSDGGQTWKTAIDGQGINVGVVYTGTLNTNNVIIGNSNSPSFRWDKSGISAYKSTDYTIEIDNRLIEVYDLQTFVRYDQYGLYGIKNNGTFTAESVEDIKEKAHFAVTWDGFFIKNNYPAGGRVEITSDNDFRVLNTVNNHLNEKIKIGALEWKQINWQKGDPIYTDPLTTPEEIKQLGPSLYGIRIKNNAGDTVMKTGDDGNLEITGTLNATQGNFSGLINVGPEDKNHIIIDGRDGINSPLIASSNYQDGAGYGWMINKNGDAVFNNITARGAIKTAVFEYAEIQAVGGIFIFRPSSTIKNAIINGNNLELTVEKPLLFKVGQWCKISNYANGNSTKDGEAINPGINDILLTNGLTYVYQIINITRNKITLAGAAQLLIDTKKTIESLIGGALVDMGNKANGNGKVGTSNYGIGINSSDNTVNLPARAISLFETVIDESKIPKVSYRYRGILGTLPVLPYSGEQSQVNRLYHEFLEKTQGIYTDNLYIGDNQQYITFYTDKEDSPQKHLIINVKEFELKTETPNRTGFLYLSNKDYGTNLTVNRHTDNRWREVIGTKFGVLKDGTLYASGAVISGTVTITNGNVYTKEETDEKLENILELDVKYTWGESQVICEALVLQNGEDIHEQYAPEQFAWELETQTSIIPLIGSTEFYQVSDYTVTISRDYLGYGAAVVLSLYDGEQFAPILTNGSHIILPDNNRLLLKV